MEDTRSRSKTLEAMADACTWALMGVSVWWVSVNVCAAVSSHVCVGMETSAYVEACMPHALPGHAWKDTGNY